MYLPGKRDFSTKSSTKENSHKSGQTRPEKKVKREAPKIKMPWACFFSNKKRESKETIPPLQQNRAHC